MPTNGVGGCVLCRTYVGTLLNDEGLCPSCAEQIEIDEKKHQTDQQQGAHQHLWDEVSYELPRSGGATNRVGWHCVTCGTYYPGYEKPPTGVLAYPDDEDDDGR